MAIMAGGRLHALGTPLRLKNRYGTGYRLNIVLSRNSDADANEIVAGLTAITPAATIAMRDASSLAIVVPFSALSFMPAILDYVDSVSEPPSVRGGGVPLRNLDEASASSSSGVEVDIGPVDAAALTHPPASQLQYPLGASSRAPVEAYGSGSLEHQREQSSSSSSSGSVIRVPATEPVVGLGPLSDDRAMQQQLQQQQRVGTAGATSLPAAPLLVTDSSTTASAARLHGTTSSSANALGAHSSRFHHHRRAPLVREYGVSGPTLESVFIAVSAAAHFELAESALRDTGGGGGGAPSAAAAAGAVSGVGPRAASATAGASAAPLGQLHDAHEEDADEDASTAVGSRLHSLDADDNNGNSVAVLVAGGASAAAAAAAGGAGNGSDNASVSSDTLITEGSSGKWSISTPAKGGAPLPPPFMYQHRALLRKNMTLLFRQRGLFLCQLFTPVLVLGLLVLLQYIIGAEMGENVYTPVQSLLLPLNMNQLLGEVYSNVPSDAPVEAYASSLGEPSASKLNLGDGLVASHYVELSTGSRTRARPTAGGTIRPLSPAQLLYQLHVRTNGPPTSTSTVLRPAAAPATSTTSLRPPTQLQQQWRRQQQLKLAESSSTRSSFGNVTSSTVFDCPFRGSSLCTDSDSSRAHAPRHSALSLLAPHPDLIPPSLMGGRRTTSWAALEHAANAAAQNTDIASAASSFDYGVMMTPSDSDASNTSNSFYPSNCLEFFIFAVSPDGTPGSGDDHRRLVDAVGSLPRQYAPPQQQQQQRRSNSSSSSHSSGDVDPPPWPPWPTPFPHNGTGLLGNIRTAWCTLHNGSVVLAPFFDPRTPRFGDAAQRASDRMDDELMWDLKLLNNVTADDLGRQPPCLYNATTGGAVTDDAALAAWVRHRQWVTLRERGPRGPLVRLMSAVWSLGRAAVTLISAPVRGVSAYMHRISHRADSGYSYGSAGVNRLEDGAGPSLTPSRSPLPYDADTERWLCPAYLLPDASVQFHAMMMPTLTTTIAGNTVPTSATSDDGSAYQLLHRSRAFNVGGIVGGVPLPSTHSGDRSFDSSSSSGSATTTGTAASSSSASLSMTLQVNDSPLSQYHRPSNFSRTGFLWGPGWMVWSAVTLTIDPAKLSLMDLLWRGYAASAGFNMSVEVPPLPPPPSRTTVHANQRPWALRDEVRRRSNADAAGVRASDGVGELLRDTAASAAAAFIDGISSAATSTSVDGAAGGVPAALPPLLPPYTVASVTAVGNMPYVVVTNTLQLVEIIGAILHPITLTLQLPLFVFITVLEKEERLIELQRAMGLQYGAYWGVTYALNFAVYTVVAGTFWGTGAALQFTFFSQTDPIVMAVVLIGWGLALCSLAMFISAFLWSRKTATVAGYVIALFGNLFAIVIAAGVYGSISGLGLTEPLPTWLYAVPLFGLVRFLYLGSFECIAKVHCISDPHVLLAPGEIRTAVLSLYIDAVVYLVLALYLDQILPRPYGVAKHPLWFLLPDDAITIGALADGGGHHHVGASPAGGTSTAGGGARASTAGGGGALSSRGRGVSDASSTAAPRTLASRLRRVWGAIRVALAVFVRPPHSATELQRRREQSAAVAQLLLMEQQSSSTAPGGAAAAGMGDGDEEGGWSPRKRRGAVELHLPLLLANDALQDAGVSRLQSGRHFLSTTDTTQQQGAASSYAINTSGNGNRNGSGEVALASSSSVEDHNSSDDNGDGVGSSRQRRRVRDVPRLTIAVPSQHHTTVPYVSADGGSASAPPPNNHPFHHMLRPSNRSRDHGLSLAVPIGSVGRRGGSSSSSGNHAGASGGGVAYSEDTLGATMALGSPSSTSARRLGVSGSGSSSYLPPVLSSILHLHNGSSSASSSSGSGGGIPLSTSAAAAAVLSGAAGAGLDVLADAITRAASTRAGFSSMLPGGRNDRTFSGADGSGGGGLLHPTAVPGLTGWDGPVFGFEGTGPDALFAYVQRWLTLAMSKLSLPRAVAAYARGEDGDVVEERREVQNDVWPEVARHLATHGDRTSASASTSLRGLSSSLRRRKHQQQQPSSTSAAAASSTAGGAASNPTTDTDTTTETVFDRYPIIIRHLRKEFRVAKPRAPGAATGWWWFVRGGVCGCSTRSGACGALCAAPRGLRRLLHRLLTTQTGGTPSAPSAAPSALLSRMWSSMRRGLRVATGGWGRGGSSHSPSRGTRSRSRNSFERFEDDEDGDDDGGEEGGASGGRGRRSSDSSAAAAARMRGGAGPSSSTGPQSSSQLQQQQQHALLLSRRHDDTGLEMHHSMSTSSVRFAPVSSLPPTGAAAVTMHSSLSLQQAHAHASSSASSSAAVSSNAPGGQSAAFVANSSPVGSSSSSNNSSSGSSSSSSVARGLNSRQGILTRTDSDTHSSSTRHALTAPPLASVAEGSSDSGVPSSSPHEVKDTTTTVGPPHSKATISTRDGNSTTISTRGGGSFGGPLSSRTASSRGGGIGFPAAPPHALEVEVDARTPMTRPYVKSEEDAAAAAGAEYHVPGGGSGLSSSSVIRRSNSSIRRAAAAGTTGRRTHLGASSSAVSSPLVSSTDAFMQQHTPRAASAAAALAMAPTAGGNSSSSIFSFASFRVDDGHTAAVAAVGDADAIDDEANGGGAQSSRRGLLNGRMQQRQQQHVTSPVMLQPQPHQQNSHSFIIASPRNKPLLPPPHLKPLPLPLVISTPETLDGGGGSVPVGLMSSASTTRIANSSAPGTPATTLNRVNTQMDPEQADLASIGVKVALSDMTLAVGRGTCLGLLGENGE